MAQGASKIGRRLSGPNAGAEFNTMILAWDSDGEIPGQTWGRAQRSRCQLLLIDIFTVRHQMPRLQNKINWRLR